MMQSLPGILKIGITPIASLPVDVILMAMSGMVVQLVAQPEIICKVGTPTCEWDDQFDNNSNYQTVRLKFRTVNELERNRWAFVVFTVDGDTLLVGADTQPYPVVEFSKATGTPSGDPSAIDYEVKWSAKKALIPCKLPTNQA